MSAIDTLLAEMFEDCDVCGGKGRDPERVHATGWAPPCRHCRGRGETLTDRGDELVARITPWLSDTFATEDHTHTIS